MTYQKLLAQFVCLMFVTLLLGSCIPIQVSPATPTLVNSPVPLTPTNSPVPLTPTNSPVPLTPTNSPVPTSGWELAVTHIEYVDTGKIKMVIYNEPKSGTLNELIDCFSQQPENARTMNCSFGVYNVGEFVMVNSALLLVQVTLKNTTDSIKTFDIKDIAILESGEGGEKNICGCSRWE